MEFQCLALFFSLIVIMMAAQAALPPEVYWERMLPNTPIPKVIREFPKLGSKDIQVQNEISGEKTKSHYGVKKISPEKNQLLVWPWPASKYKLQDGVKKISPEENQLLIWPWSASKYELQDGVKKISPEENQLLVWPWPASKYELQDGVKKVSPEENQLLIWPWSASKYELQDGVKKISPEENQLLVWPWPARKYELQDGVKKVSPEENQLLIWPWSASKYELQDGVKNVSPEENQLLVWSWPPSKYDVKKNQLEDDGKEIPANHHHRDHSKSTIFFFEEELKQGAKFDTHFRKMEYLAPLLSREITENIPFSSEKIKEILEILAVKPESWNAKNVEKSLEICEEPAMNGEEKQCATSVESMVDFVTSKLGKNVHVTSTEVEIESKSQKFIVKDGVKILAEEEIIACHPMNYPYVVFYCHKISNSTAHFVPLEGEDGTRIKAIAVCHKDTSEWNPDHIAMQVLKVKPGTSPVCHFFPDGHLLWYAKEG